MPRSYRVFTESNYAHFVTATIVDWMPVFVSRPYFDIVVESLKFLRANKGIDVNAYVIMPTHLHAVLFPHEVSLSDVMRDFKRHTSKQISAQLREDGQENFCACLPKPPPGAKVPSTVSGRRVFTRRRYSPLNSHSRR
jgi:REP element-mobilizing transposase RayT